ncbi:serine protease HTRA3 isoform X2 [Sparus aurata]|uniref:serine protease HTRA3 isoform X2 n=1 Tax=Sparus aurata TaxID=8175 RepID=UPI0011C1CF4D|nr:serine protease HTRA3 isoform X2 [Sparus aurata]
MQIILYTAVLFYLKESVSAEPNAKCPTQCNVSTCPSPICPRGYVPDRCDCCLICAQGEGEPCGSKDDLLCGDGLDCKQPAGKRLSKSVCLCKLSYEVCGSDGKTYSSVCQLKATSRKALQQGLPGITQIHKGPCETSIGPSNAASPRYKFNFIADVVEKIAPAVVHIELFLRHPLFGRNIPLSSGSGFVMSENGLIVTNAHVVSSITPVSGQQHLKVQMHNGDVYEANIKDIDKKSDIATIKINPQYGNSGGPLVNLDGEVIGINTLKVAAGISFAIPSDRITHFLNDSLNKHSKDEISTKKRFIGIRMLTITPALIEELKQQNSEFPDVTSGIFVHEVVPHSPAHKGGIKDGDIIVKLNGRPLKTTADLQKALQEETALLLEVRRDNDDLLFNIEPDIIMQ